MIAAGIDCGSRLVKVVLWDTAAGRIVATQRCDEGVAHGETAAAALAGALATAGFHPGTVACLGATGYGRHAVPGACLVATEITCQARGIAQLCPGARTVIDVGGQDSKVIWLDARGQMRDFAMNDRCAAGSGRFLEMVAARLGLPLAEAGRLPLSACTPAAVTSTCAVFAETEIVGLLAAGCTPEAVLAGVYRALARRLVALPRAQVVAPLVFTGGVATLPGAVAALERELGLPVQCPADPFTTAALGAALLAAERRA